MQRRNRRKKVHTFPLPIPFAGVLSLLVILGIAYVWLHARCEQVGREIRALERHQTELQKRLAYEEFRWARMRSPEGIAAALARHRITMDWPRPEQIVLIPTLGARDTVRVAFAQTETHRYTNLGSRTW
ncbi:MAG: hypothetical protein N2255_05005 [Kiritimatiellae bacterium]|nr:hypothetical protein [Kiritimatiellia bacterium]